MVCDSCQTKVTKVIVPDKWKDGARNSLKAPGKTNKALVGKKLTQQWIPNQCLCRLCKSKVQLNMHYCNDCAHKKGICPMCGKKNVDVSKHKMSLT